MKNCKTSFNQRLYVNNQAITKMREANIIQFMIWWNDELITYDKGSCRLIDNPSITLFNNMAYDHSGKAFSSALNTLDFVTDIIYNGSFRKATIAMSYFLRSNKDKLEAEVCALYKQSSHCKLSYSVEDNFDAFDLDILFNYDKERFNKWIFGYLCNERKVDRHLIAELLNRKLISFDSNGKNVLFITYNSNNEVISVEKKGTYRGKKFAQVHSKESNIPFVYMKEDADINDIDTAYVFESSIDLLSYITLYNVDCNAVYISTRGVSKIGCVSSILESHSNIETICVCFDNDVAGAKMHCEISAKYKKEYEIAPTFPPYKKDWNEYLLTKAIA